MKLLRLVLAAAALSAGLVACDPARSTAPQGVRRTDSSVPPDTTPIRPPGQTMGSGG